MAKRPAVLATLGTLFATVSAIGAPPAQAATPSPLPITVVLPAQVNLAGAGYVPVTLLSTEGADATAVDPATVRLGGSPVARGDGGYLATTADADGDGRADLVLHAGKEQLIQGGLGPDTKALTVTGSLHDGRAFEASGAVTPEVALEVKFRETLGVRGTNQSLRSTRGENLDPVQTVLDRHRARSVAPLVPSASVARLDDQSAKARARTGAAAPDMASWYSVVLPADADVDQVVEDLRSLPEVVFAYPAPDLVPPPSAPTPDFTGMQGYQRPAPQGIDADFSHRDPRTRGAGIKIVDLEYDWNMSHEDLPLDSSSDLGGSVFPRYTGFADEHGTAVFGELVAEDNEYGVIGSVPEATMYGISPSQALPSGGTRWSPGAALAYLAGLGVLAPGDAVLLEQQTSGPLGGSNYAPLEWIPSVFDAIQLLDGLGVTVVETGGNGNQNVDSDIYVQNGIKWFDRSVQDSGAILVGAGSSTDHERLDFSNHGARFDLQGWGHNIVTSGGNGNLQGGTDPANLNVRYTRTFGGTSGAGPIVTGAVVAVQSYLKATGQAPWSAAKLADLLKRTGTPQGSATAAAHIGPLPNVAAALKAIEVDPPTTEARLTQRPPRDGDAYVNPVVTLTAGDGWGSGVTGTQYRLDGGKWKTYSEPFRVLRKGEHTLAFRSADANGNQEKIRSLSFTNR
ncbi:S8 family serine peptidase [Nonomuraea sp. K274]|uniref:S8 family serine peptidase n=1 Tax=Nonomuraea cypriaca TaxID=1187855 RepID=A0A931EY75_9ACTN|nr:S8 family serine peptidase [Nonomuraea cypriaca]MBF8187025.1 S8 family serine peptidase [Nonomuraea cypriaca]